MEGSDDGSISSSPKHARRQDIEELKQMLVCTSLELESIRAKMRSQRQMFETRVNHLEELLRQAQNERQVAVQRYEELVHLSSSSSIPVEEDDEWLLFPSLDQQRLDNESMFYTPLQQPDSSKHTAFPQETWMNEPQVFLGNAEAGEASVPTGLLLQNGSALASILTPLQQQQQQQQQQDHVTPMSLKLPEKGRLLEAVMQAGPLLNTLLLAGPLPEWHHPPPGIRVEHQHPIVIPPGPCYNASSPAASEQQQSSCVSDGEPSECPSFVYKQHATKVC